MMFTREQAEDVWCPMVRLSSMTVAYNATGNMRAPRDSRCVADKCAMWRWGTYDGAPAGAQPGKLYLPVKYQAQWGYCGLAGVPQSMESEP